nr:alpha/beta fold hydrolase [Leptospira kobayashii]
MGYYLLVVIHIPELFFVTNSFNQKIISECKTLLQPYRPTFWCFNRHLMLVVLLFREFRSKEYKYDLIEQVRMKDGGITGLAWSGITNIKSKDRTPIVVIFHTIAGDEQDVKNTVRYITSELNWIAVVCIRRGHGSLPLTKPQINTMGSTSDLKKQLDHIHKKFPNAPLFGVGISAGSGLLARYLGESGLKSKFKAAVAISPAYDIEKAFHRIHPMYSKIMGQRLIDYFLKKHYESLSQLKGFPEVMNTKTMGEFQDRLHHVAGYKSKEEYYLNSNPINVAKNIKTPLLILNSEDDPICVYMNVMENLHWLTTLQHSILVKTKRGSHVAYFEGLFANSWSDSVLGEYFQAVLKQTETVKTTRKVAGKKKKK